MRSGVGKLRLIDFDQVRWEEAQPPCGPSEAPPSGLVVRGLVMRQLRQLPACLRPRVSCEGQDAGLSADRWLKLFFQRHIASVKCHTLGRYAKHSNMMHVHTPASPRGS